MKKTFVAGALAALTLAAAGGAAMAQQSPERPQARTLRADNGLFSDSIKVETGAINKDQLTYNAALMMRAYLYLHQLTGEDIYLDEANVVAKAANSLLDRETGAYRDAIKWAHLMVEADIELYRYTGEQYLLDRAKTNCDVHYAAWKKELPRDLMANASLARELWLMADLEKHP